MEGVDPGRSLVLLSLLAALCSIAGASGCRYHETGCADASSCWKGGKNTTVPADCKCCVGYPYHPRGECRRWAKGVRSTLMIRFTSSRTACFRDCPRNPDFYVVELQNRMSAGTCTNGN